MNLWAVEYEYLGEPRAMLFEYPSDFGYAEVSDAIHPAIKAKNPSITYIGEVYGV